MESLKKTNPVLDTLLGTGCFVSRNIIVCLDNGCSDICIHHDIQPICGLHSSRSARFFQNSPYNILRNGQLLLRPKYQSASRRGLVISFLYRMFMPMAQFQYWIQFGQTQASSDVPMGEAAIFIVDTKTGHGVSRRGEPWSSTMIGIAVRPQSIWVGVSRGEIFCTVHVGHSSCEWHSSLAPLLGPGLDEIILILDTETYSFHSP